MSTEKATNRTGITIGSDMQSFSTAATGCIKIFSCNGYDKAQKLYF